jgi:hypothetical protein
MAQPANSAARCVFKTFDMTSPVCRRGALDCRAASEARQCAPMDCPRGCYRGCTARD